LPTPSFDVRQNTCTPLQKIVLDPDHAVNEPQLIGQSPRILVVDDNDHNRYTLSLYLELEGSSNLESGGRR